MVAGPIDLDNFDLDPSPRGDRGMMMSEGSSQSHSIERARRFIDSAKDNPTGSILIGFSGVLAIVGIVLLCCGNNNCCWGKQAKKDCCTVAPISLVFSVVFAVVGVLCACGCGCCGKSDA